MSAFIGSRPVGSAAIAYKIMLRRQVTIGIPSMPSSKPARRMAAVAKSKASRSNKAGKLRRAVAATSIADVKQVVTALGATVTAGTPLISPISLIADGDSFNQRDGRKVKLLNVKIRGSLVASATQDVRYIVFIDRQSNGVVPTAAQLLRSTPLVADAVNNDNSDRFIILADITRTQSSTNQGLQQDLNLFLPLKGITASFIGTTAAQASVGSNGVYVYMDCSAGTCSQAQQCDLHYVE